MAAYLYQRTLDQWHKFFFLLYTQVWLMSCIVHLRGLKNAKKSQIVM